MVVFFLGVVLFLFGFIAHVAPWRIRRRGIAALRSPALVQANWVGWSLPAATRFRYCKLVIQNKVSEQFHTFYSISKLELYE